MTTVEGGRAVSAGAWQMTEMARGIPAVHFKDQHGFRLWSVVRQARRHQPARFLRYRFVQLRSLRARFGRECNRGLLARRSGSP